MKDKKYYKKVAIGIVVGIISAIAIVGFIKAPSKSSDRLAEDLQKELDERYSVAKKLSEEVEKELDEKYQPSVPVSETAPEAPVADTLWVDKKNLQLKLWDGEQWQTIGYEPEQPTEPTTPTEPEKPEPENPDTEGKDNGNKEETDDKKTDQEGGSA